MNKLLFHNEDCTQFFYSHKGMPEGGAGELIDRYVDVMAGAGVTVFLINTNSRKTNYESTVWESFWDGYDPDGPDDQPFLAPLSAESTEGIKRYRNVVDNMLAVHRQGIDYPARMIQRCRHDGMSPWITLRMNDCHCTNNMEHPFHGSFWKNNPRFYTSGLAEYFSKCLDYTFPEVRDYYMALIDETLERYDLDGLELDFMREPYLFDRGKEAAGGAILNEWMRAVRMRVDASAKKRNHPIKLGVRVPSRPETAMALGLDFKTWVGEKLIDLLVFTPRFNTLEFDMPVREWRELVGKESGVTLAGGIEVHYMPRPWSKHDRPERVSPELAIGAATTILHGGADAVYLFNYFQPVLPDEGHPRWDLRTFQKTLNAMSSMESITVLPRRIGVTWRDITAPGEKYRPPLPAKGSALDFKMKLGPVPESTWQCSLRIGLAPEDDLPAVSVNGKPCEPGKEDEKDSTERTRFFVCDVPLDYLKGTEIHKVKISADADTPITVRQLEVLFSPPA